MTECRGPTVIPAKAGIQRSDYFQLTWAFWITKFFIYLYGFILARGSQRVMEGKATEYLLERLG